MVHEGLQTDIVGENGLSCLRNASVAAGCVRCRGIELAEQETRLRTAGVTDDESRQWESVLNELLGILLRCLQKLSEVLVTLLLLVASFPPLGHCFAVEDENVEETVEEKNVLWLNAGRVEKNWHAAILIKCVAV